MRDKHCGERMFDVAIYGDDVPFLERIEKYTVGALFDEDELIIDLYDDGAELVNEINKTKINMI